MIKRQVDLKCHIKYDIPYLIDNSNFLIGIMYKKHKETDETISFSYENIMLNFDDDLNVSMSKCFNTNEDCKIIYCNNDKIVFLISDNLHKRLVFKSIKKNFELDLDCNDTCFANKDYIIIKKKNNEILVFDGDFEKYIEEVDIDKISKDYYGISIQNFVESNHPNVFKYIYKIIDKKRVFCFECRDGCNSIYIYDKEKIICKYLFKKKEQYRIHDFYIWNNKVYIVYIGIFNEKYVLFSYDLIKQIYDEEEIKCYACFLTVITGTLCLISDLSSNYSREQKKLKNQILCGTSSLLILE